MEMEYGVFGEDILVEIFKRLPKKYQFRFRCVSKGWLHLLSDRTRLSPTTTTDTVLLLQYRLSGHSMFTFLRVTNDDSPSDVHSLCFFLDLRFVPIDSCNGLLLFGVFNRWNSISSYLVYHPATKQYSAHVLPPPCEDESFFQVGFAFDGHHYQLICLCPKDLDLHVFSSQTGEWRVIKHVMIPHPSHVLYAWGCYGLRNKSSLFLKGAVHWLLGGSLFIYHLKDEHLEVVELPAYVGYFRTALSSPRRCIWNSEGRLNYCYCDDQSRIYIYVLCKSDDWEDYTESGRSPDFQWLLKYMGAFTIPNPKWSWDFFKRRAVEAEYKPCAFDDDFEIVYVKSPEGLFAYKLETGVMNKVETGVMKEVRINRFGVSNDDYTMSISAVFPFLYP